jgi:hypothetical protein
MLNRIYTIGHSTRTLAELVALLRDHGVTRLHIIGPGSAQPHILSEMAKIEGDRVIYPPPQTRMF